MESATQAVLAGKVPPVVSILTAATLLVVVVVVRLVAATSRPQNFPPGPPTAPFVGNTHQINPQTSFLQYMQWRKIYGDVLGLKFGPQSVVVLHDPRHVREFLVKRGAVYSERTKPVIVQDHVLSGGDGNRHVAFMDLDFQRRFKRAVRAFLSPNGLERIHPIQQAMAARLLHGLLEDQTGYRTLFSNWALSTPLPMVMAKRIEDLGQEWVLKYRSTIDSLMKLFDPSNVPPVELFPILGFLPEWLAPWKRTARATGREVRSFYSTIIEPGKRQYQEFRDAAASGATQGDPDNQQFESVVARILREQDERSREGKDSALHQQQPLTERDISFMAGGLIDAAHETTLNTALFLLQGLATNKAAQRKAQAEVDQHLGTTRLPDGDREIDVNALAYLNACLMEALRWRPIVPLSVPRLSTADRDEVITVDSPDGSTKQEQYHIPKGSTILINVWSIGHDPDEYEDPESFNPDRYMKNQYGIKEDSVLGEFDGRLPVYAFGMGRRVCPGEKFALQALKLAFVHILWSFDIEPVGEINLNVETGLHVGLTLGPNPFQLKFTPRPGREQGIIDAYERAEKVVKARLT